MILFKEPVQQLISKNNMSEKDWTKQWNRPVWERVSRTNEPAHTSFLLVGNLDFLS